MSVVPPPNPNVDRFNNTYWTSVDAGSLNIAELETYFLTFPSAQGTENLLATNTLGQANFYADIEMIGSTNTLTFPDGSVQTTAYTGGGGSGGAILADNQTFTGYNQFDNNSGINLINTTSTNSVAIGADSTTNGLLNISGNLKVGNGSLIATNMYSAAGSTNNSINLLSTLSGNTSTKTGLGVYYNANSTGEVDLIGMGNADGGGFNFYQSNASTLNNIMGINSSGVSLVNGSNSILLSADDTTDNQLDINGALSTTGDIYLNGLQLGKDVNTSGLNIINAGLTIGNTTNNGFYCILSSNTTTNQVLDITGDATISATKTYGTTYPDQSIATIGYVNGSVSTSIIGADNTWTGTNAFDTSTPTTSITQTYPQSTNTTDFSTIGYVNNGVLGLLGRNNAWTGTNAFNQNSSIPTTSYNQVYPQSTNTTQFTTIGYVNTGISSATSNAGSKIAGTSTAPQTWTGYNNFYHFQSNGIGAPLKFTSSSVVGTSTSTTWNFTNFPTTTLGNGFTFAFSTNFTPPNNGNFYGNLTAIPLASTANTVNGLGLGTLQTYKTSAYSGDFYLYVFSFTSFNGVTGIFSQSIINTTAPTGPPVVTIAFTTLSTAYYYNNNISLSMYVYPQSVGY